MTGDATHARIFREAQQAADTIFSHYQLSQLLATHELPDTMAQAILDELAHVCDASAGCLWLARAGATELVARTGDAPSDAEPGDLSDWIHVDLEDVGTIALRPSDTAPVEPTSRRFLDLVRHELAMALRGALLRETLERERAELAAIVQGASDAIVLVDTDRRVTRVNPAAERMLGRPAAVLIGAPCDRVLDCHRSGTPPRPCAGRCPFERALRHGESLDGDERVLPSPTGGTSTVVGSYAVTSAARDGTARAVGIFRDTTELARIAELRRGFLGSVSHELRTPVALIRGYVETLLEFEPDPGTTRTYLRRIEEASGRLSAMVSQILDASALAVDRLELHLATIDLGALVSEAVEELRVRHPDVPVEVSATVSMPPVTADPERIRQVIDNLLSNAAKYGGGGFEVAISVRGDDAVVRVADHGIGVPSDERELVFEQFHRARNVREGSLPGSGLGLSTSRRIAEAHGGSLAFDPDRPHGAAVELRLPVTAGAPDGPALDAPYGVLATASAHDPGPRP
jgi:PAS domain S-box-containing protein